MKHLKCLISSWDLVGKTVFLRADLNVPLKAGHIYSDIKLKALQPTIDLLRKKQARIILATHLGRPTEPDPTLSTEQLMGWFEKQGYNIIFAANLTQACEKAAALTNGDILLLENMRFYPGERSQDGAFSAQLRALAQFYVNDAFGLLHRNDASITLLPSLYDAHHKSIGLLVEHELEALAHLKKPEHPFVLILGGGKVSDKLPMLESLLDKVDTLLLCPAICFTFVHALGKPVGASLVDTQLLDKAKEIMAKAKAHGVRIEFPRDYLVAQGSINGPLSMVDADKISSDQIGISIGPKTEKAFNSVISQAKTIFYNGAMGFQERPETQESLKTLLQAIAQSTAFTVVGGGDSVAAVYKYGLNSAIHFCSTGGGAAIAYFADRPLPGLTFM